MIQRVSTAEGRALPKTAGKKPTRPKAPSHLEERLLLHIRAAGLPEPVREFRFHPTRAFRADFAWVGQRLLVECEGGTFSPGGGRHSRGAGFEADCLKYGEAMLMGWKVLRVTEGMIRRGQALSLIEQALKP